MTPAIVEKGFSNYYLGSKSGAVAKHVEVLLKYMITHKGGYLAPHWRDAQRHSLRRTEGLPSAACQNDGASRDYMPGLQRSCDALRVTDNGFDTRACRD